MFEGYKISGGGTSFGQSATTEFLVKQDIPQSDIHIHALLQSAYGDVYMGASGVRR